MTSVAQAFLTFDLVGELSSLSKRQIQIPNSLVDFRGILIPNRNAIYSSVLERKPHRRLPVFPPKRSLAHKLHADDTHSVSANLLDVADNFGNIAQSSSVVILGVHAFAFVIYPDHRNVKPLIFRHLPQGWS